MYRVVYCLTTQHDDRLVVLAGLICAIAALSSLKIYSHVLASHGFQRLGLLLLVGVCSGAGIWATHFVAMLAYEPGVPTTYEPIATTTSLFIAVAATTFGFAISSAGTGPWPGVGSAVVGGTVIGAGIGLMHYSGMGALIVPGTLAWDPASVAASLAIGTVLSIAAMITYHRSNLRPPWIAAALLTLAICGLHFTAMGAVTILPDPAIVAPSSRIGDSVMAFAVAGATLLVMLSGVTSIAFMENRTRRAREEELYVQNVRFETALRYMSQGFCMFDADKRLAVCNDRYAKLYQLPPELLKVGTSHDAIIAHRVSNGILKGEKSAAAVAQKISALGRLPADARSNRVDELADGRLICVTREPMAGGGWVATHEDISARVLAEKHLEQTKAFLDTVIENIPLPVVVKDPHTLAFVLVNHAYERFLGTTRENIIGKTIDDLLPPESAGRVLKYDQETLSSGKDLIAAEFEVITPANGVRFLNTTRLVVRNRCGEPEHLISVLEDITDRRKSEEKILHMARHDALTDLPNRVLLRDRLEHALTGIGRGQCCLAVLMLDLDRFKEINDTLGHPVGDSLLKAVAERLRSCVREGTTIARLGGDEFAVIEHVTDPIVEASALAERVQAALGAAFDLGDHQVVAGSSIGIAVAPRDGTDADQLLKNADLALYRAKGDGRGTHRFFESEMNRLMQARRDLERDLRNALANGEFDLHYQPVINLQCDTISSCEALLRWQHPTRGMVFPTEFILLAEETGLIAPIGEWVLRNACAEAATWPDHVNVAVNLSLAQFRGPQLLPAVVSALASSGVRPQRLELEVTETVLMHDSEATFATLRQLHELGVRIALDDFGTGYSSLNFLRSFPFDKIKIDRSFVNELSHAREESRAIVRAVVRLANSLDKTTTAEGVETRELLDLVRAEGCTEAQGYYFSQPKPSSEIAALFFSRADEAVRVA
jgi:diguanylate cyclase (GGDEF)-like protein/PAS domain S-box-containing protein